MENTFQINPNQVKNKLIGNYLKLQSIENLCVNISKSSGNSPQKIEGNIKGQWLLSGTKQTLKKIEVCFDLIKDPNTQENQIQFNSIKANLNTLSLEASLQENEPLIFKTIEGDPSLFFKAFSDTLDAKDVISTLGLNQPQSLHIILLNRSEKITSRYVWKQTLNLLQYNPTGLILNNVESIMQVESIPDKDDYVYDTWKYSISGEVVWKKEGKDDIIIDGMLSFDPYGRAYMSLIKYDEGFISFEEMAENMGLITKEQSADLKRYLPILNDMGIHSLSITTDLHNKKIEKVSLSAMMAIEDEEFEFIFNYPDLSVEARLVPETPIQLYSFFKKLDPNLAPHNARITVLDLMLQVKPLQLSCGISIEDPWAFHLGNTPILLENVSLQIQKNEAGFTGAAETALKFANTEFLLFCTYDNGWFFEATESASSEIPLTHLITELAQLFHFNLPFHIPDVTVKSLDLSFHTGTHNFHLSGEIEINLFQEVYPNDGKDRSSKNSGIGPIQEGKLQIEIDLTKNTDTGKHDFIMNLSGSATIGGNELTLSAQDIGRKDWEFTLDWQKEENGAGFDLMSIVHLFDKAVNTPEDFKDKLVNNKLLVDQLHMHYEHGVDKSEKETGRPSAFNVSVKLDENDSDLGLILAGNKVDEKWDFLFGGYYEKKEDVPKFKDHKIDFDIESIWFLVNTADEKGGQWPPLPDNFPHSLSQHELKKGVMVAAALDIVKDGPEVLKKIHDFLPKGEDGKKISSLSLLLEISENPVGIQIEALLNGSICIPTEKGHYLEIKDACLLFQAPNLKLSIQGEIDTIINDRVIVAQGGLDVGLDGIDERIVIQSDKGISLFDLKGVLFKELGFEIGVDFEPPGVRLGILGKFQLEGEQKTDEVGVVMEFVGPVPNPEYLDLKFAELDFTKVLELFPGSSAHGHKVIGKKLLKIEDASLNWAEKALTLPDGKSVTPGFGFHGLFELFDWGAYFALDAHPQTGISGKGLLSPLKIGPLSIGGNGEGMFYTEQWNGTKWVKVSNLPQKSTPNQGLIRTQQLIQPGGAEIEFNSNHAPYLKMGINLHLFETKILEIDADIEDDKIHFLFFLNLLNVAKFKLSCDLTKGDNAGFDISGKFFLGFHIKFDIPAIFFTIHVDIQLGIAAGLEIHQHKDSGFELKIEGEFNFLGKTISLANLDFKLPPEALNNLSKWILDFILHGEVPDFKSKIDDGSGKNESNDYGSEKWKAATAYLALAKTWAAQVNEDLKELEEEKHWSDKTLQGLIDKIRASTNAINSDTKANENALDDLTQTESDRLENLAENVKGLSDKGLSDAYKDRDSEIKRMQREINDIQDEKGKLRAHITDIWELHSLELIEAEQNLLFELESMAMEGTNEDILKAKEKREAVHQTIQQEIDALKATDEELGGTQDDLSPVFAPIAVDHFSFLIKNEWEAQRYQQSVLVTAEKQAKQIINEAHKIRVQ